MVLAVNWPAQAPIVAGRRSMPTERRTINFAGHEAAHGLMESSGECFPSNRPGSVLPP